MMINLTEDLQKYIINYIGTKWYLSICINKDFKKLCDKLEIEKITCNYANYAAKNGDLQSLKYLYKNYHDILYWNLVCSIIAKNGHLDCLKYVHGIDIYWDEDIGEIIALNGHLDCLKYVFELGCNLDEEISACATLYGHLDCLKFAHENGCELGDKTLRTAIYGNSTECIEYINKYYESDGFWNSYRMYN